MWLPWTPTREEAQLDATAAEKPKEQEQWVMEEEKLKNTPAHSENHNEKLANLLFGMDIKKSVL
jgi:hypothetical protein